MATRWEFDVSTTQTRALLLYGLSVVLLVMPFFASTGFFIIDEVIYVLSVQAFHAGQGFFIDNGSQTYATEDIAMLGLLVPSAGGLVPQYPAGLAIVGSLFFEVLGARGLLLINALAAVGTLFVTHMLAMRLFDSEKVANFAVVLFAVFSFMPEFAVAFWPHMVSILSVSLAFFFFLRALDEPPAFAWAFASGLVLGGGLLFRLDGVLLLSTIALVTALYAQRPLSVFGGGALGMMPGFLLMAWINSIKFGTFNPISYGHTAGNAVDPTKYASFALVAGFATLVIWAIRMRGGVPRVAGIAPKVWGLVLVFAVILAALFVPQLERLLVRAVKGFYALMIDSKAIQDSRPGVWRGAENTLFLWGMTKKALGQSLPWLGMLAALFFLPTAERRRSITIILIFAALWSLPFILRIWHGGLGSNMRYFMPMLPALSALSAWVIVALLERVENPVRPIMIGVLIAIGAIQAWLMLRVSGAAGVQQILSTYVLYAVVVLVCVGLLVERARAGLGVAVGLSLAMALGNSLMDQAAAQDRRLATYEAAEAFSRVEGPVLVYSAPENAIYADRKTDVISAIAPFDNDGPDQLFVGRAIADGYRAFVPTAALQIFPGFEAVSPSPEGLPAPFSEIVAR